MQLGLSLNCTLSTVQLGVPDHESQDKRSFPLQLVKRACISRKPAFPQGCPSLLIVILLRRSRAWIPGLQWRGWSVEGDSLSWYASSASYQQYIAKMTSHLYSNNTEDSWTSSLCCQSQRLLPMGLWGGILS